MLYDSPCDEPGYYFHEYGSHHIDEDYFDQNDDQENNELLEVNWESPK